MSHHHIRYSEHRVQIVSENQLPKKHKNNHPQDDRIFSSKAASIHDRVVQAATIRQEGVCTPYNCKNDAKQTRKRSYSFNLLKNPYVRKRNDISHSYVV